MRIYLLNGEWTISWLGTVRAITHSKTGLQMLLNCLNIVTTSLTQYIDTYICKDSGR